MAELVPLGVDMEVGVPVVWRRRLTMDAVIAGIFGVVLLSVCTTTGVFSAPPSAGVAQPPLGQATPQELHVDRIVVVPPREQCAALGLNCLAQKCCMISGYTCYEKRSGYATCMKKCTPGVTGTCLTRENLAPTREDAAVSWSATTLFCFAVYMQDTGSTKPNHDLDLLRTSLFVHASIFGCEASRVYSDVSTWLSPGKVFTVKVEDEDNNFHYEKRKETGTWINANVFIAVWKKIREEDVWSSKDWTVKVDADTVFLPSRLRQRLSKQAVTANGVYLENCKYVNYGFFGSLEVMSHKAVAAYLANIDDCKTSLNYMGHEKVTGSEPWGEDLFLQRCMDMHGVDKVVGWGITTDGMCEAWRPDGEKKNKKWKPDCAITTSPAMHPFQTPKQYFDCLRATQR